MSCICIQIIKAVALEIIGTCELNYMEEGRIHSIISSKIEHHPQYISDKYHVFLGWSHINIPSHI